MSVLSLASKRGCIGYTEIAGFRLFVRASPPPSQKTLGSLFYRFVAIPYMIVEYILIALYISFLQSTNASFYFVIHYFANCKFQGTPSPRQPFFSATFVWNDHFSFLLSLASIFPFATLPGKISTIYMLSQACHSGKPDPKQRTTQAPYPPACGLFRTLP